MSIEQGNTVVLLSEQKLLLLSTLMYLDFSEAFMDSQGSNITIEYITKYYLDRWETSNYADDLSGGFENRPEDFKKILEEIQALIKKDPSFGALRIEHPHDYDGIRAAAFVDSMGNATIAFRGTGGIYDAWRDNLQGAGVTDTEAQEAAKRYVESLIGKYKSIELTGHSKGGNLAQYVAILLGDFITRCVSFDGQGFSRFFLSEYKSLIARHRHKITSISAHNDFVNILMFSIAGRIAYVKNKGKFGEAHDPDRLYFDSEFDGLGRISNADAEQDYYIGLLGDSIRVYLNNLPQAESELASEVLGLLLAPFMSKDFDLFTVEGFIETLQEGISAAREYISNSKVGPLAGIRAKWAFRFALTSTLSYALAGLAKDGLITLGKGIADGAKGIASAIQNHFIRKPREAEQLVSMFPIASRRASICA